MSSKRHSVSTDTQLTDSTLEINENPESRLMQLPAEVRLKILRSLLKGRDNGIIEPLYVLVYAYGHHDTFKRQSAWSSGSDHSTQLSSQVLRVCRHLHTESSAVLYRENVSVVCCGFAWDAFSVVSALDNMCNLSDRVTRLPDSAEAFRRFASGLPQVAKTAGILKQFEGLHIRMCLRNQSARSIYIICHHLQSLAAVEKLVLTVHIPERSGPFTADHARSLQGLQCKVFKLVVEAQAKEKIQITDEFKEDIERTMISDKPPFHMH